MVSACVVVVAAFVNGPVMEQAQFQETLGAFQRLIAAVPPLKADANVQERTQYQASRAELEALHNYLEKFRVVMAIGKYDESYRSNVMLVARQFVSTGMAFAVFPEEALCWQRVGLRIAALNREAVQ